MIDAQKEEIIKNKIAISSAKESFVYFLIDGSEIVYVGKTTMGIARLLSHCGVKEFDSYSTISCKPEHLDKMESHYIYKFAPKYNVLLPLNDVYISRHQFKKQYRVEGNAWKKIMKLYGIKSNSLDCYVRSEVEDALQRAKDDHIIYYDSEYSNGNDWFMVTKWNTGR